MEHIGVVLLAAAVSATAGTLRPVSPADCMPGVHDYAFLWWANGVPADCSPRRGKAPATSDRRKLICVQTGTYGAALDVDKVDLVRLGSIADAPLASEVVASGNETVLGLPRSALALTVALGDRVYRCTGRRTVKRKGFLRYPYRLIESGRFLHRFDVSDLIFADGSGAVLEADGRLELVAWPDRLALLLAITPRSDLGAARLKIALSPQNAASESAVSLRHGQVSTVALALTPDGPPLLPPVVRVAARKGKPLRTEYDAARQWLRVELPRLRLTNRDGTYFPAEHLDHLERMQVSVENPSDAPQTARLLFARDSDFPGVTGFCPMLRDTDGHPTGLPVQLSKNWHSKPGERVLYDGVWFHGFSVLRLPPRSRLDVELAIAYARWGGVPAVSHAQLCLIGWGHNQRWDEVAVGSFGESICYEPDGAQRRCMIDDVRPLMVRGIGEKDKKFGWTNNVGGGDFLVYIDDKGDYQYYRAMKALYTSHGPNLTDVTYAGATADGHIDARITVSTARADDLVRCFHRFRYDVRKPTPFQRLAFYQLGADHYLWHAFGKIARGDATGLAEEWKPRLGGRTYARTGIRCEGEAPWFSLHESVPRNARGGAWANRGLIVRSWRARLGGKDIPVPFASVYGTQSGIASAALELSPPPGVRELLPGDFVEAEVELIVVPMAAADYYGPNAGLRAALQAGANTWRPVHREARGNCLTVRAAQGTVLRRYPVTVRVAADETADLTVTGGIGCVPVTFVGLRGHRTYALDIEANGRRARFDQSVHGNDYWQTDYDPAARTWRVTYGIPLDTAGDAPRTVRLYFARRNASAK